jgi:hypothetical protein
MVNNNGQFLSPSRRPSHIVEIGIAYEHPVCLHEIASLVVL